MRLADLVILSLGMRQRGRQPYQIWPRQTRGDRTQEVTGARGRRRGELLLFSECRASAWGDGDGCTTRGVHSISLACFCKIG